MVDEALKCGHCKEPIDELIEHIPFNFEETEEIWFCELCKKCYFALIQKGLVGMFKFD